MKPRTQEEFDDWFRRTNGDPWGYGDNFVRQRLVRSCDFLVQQLGDFEGTFIEFGAFDGSFTELLTRAFPASTIYANDISSVALEKMMLRLASQPRIHLVKGDMLSFNPDDFPLAGKGRLAVLLLECLYYLPPGQQAEFLHRLHTVYGDFFLFLSAPMTGGNYYTESSLKHLLAETGFAVQARLVLNFARPIPRLIRALRLHEISSYFRTRFANQVIHCIRPVRLQTPPTLS